MSDLTLLFTG